MLGKLKQCICKLSPSLIFFTLFLGAGWKIFALSHAVPLDISGTFQNFSAYVTMAGLFLNSVAFCQWTNLGLLKGSAREDAKWVKQK